MAAGACCTRQSLAQGEAPVIAVAEIQYIDTSGEVLDQTADHFRRLREFEGSLRTDLTASGKLQNVALDCPPNACSIGDIDADRLLDKAQAAGAGYLLISSFHKLSTLVQWGDVQLLDLEANKVLFRQNVTFRGDTDEAFSRAAAFVGESVRDAMEKR